MYYHPMAAVTDTNGNFQRISLADQVADAILSLVTEGDLQPGAQLPSTGELAERFRVSRSVVREALAVLDGRGIVDRSQGREATVADPGAAQFGGLLTYRWDRGQLSPQDVLELRCSIEVAAARHAAERLDTATTTALETAYDALGAAQTDDELLRADIAFHRAVALASGNDLLALVLDAVAPLLHQVRHDALTARRAAGGDPAEIVAEIRNLLDGILSGDPDKAARSMTDHLERPTGVMRVDRRHSGSDRRESDPTRAEPAKATGTNPL